jgi:hypothetical protein
MKERKVEFYSDGLKLDGAFYFPDGGDNLAQPVVITCSGFTGLKNIHPERFARAWTKKGFTCFGFDYRGFCNSEGEPGRVRIAEQVQDIISAVRFVRSVDEFAGRPLVLAGWGMAGGLILDAAHNLQDELDGMVAMNGFYNAVRVQKALRGQDGWQDFIGWVQEQGKASAKSKGVDTLDPFDIYPLDPVSREYVDNVLRKNEDYGITSTIEFADSLLSFCPESRAGELSIPLYVAHGADNALHPVNEAKSLFEAYTGPKDIFLLDGAGHTEWMLDDNPLFIKFSDTIAVWLAQFELDEPNLQSCTA